ncbi:12851_t:CDS:1, partial [Gigaspora margarita]
ASSKQASNTVILALPLTLNTKSDDIGILLSVLNMTSFASVEFQQTIFGHAPSLISVPILPTMVSQQAKLIMNPDQLQLPIPQIGQLLAPDDKVPSPNTEVPTLAPESIIISSEEMSEGIEIDLNLDTASVTSTRIRWLTKNL